MYVFISGHPPVVRRGAERFSRLLIALNTWLSAAYALHSVHIFIRQKDFAFTS